MTIRSILKKGVLLGFPCVLLVAMALLWGGLHRGTAASGIVSVAGGAVEANLAGRLIVDSSGSAQLIGYYPYIYGLPANLFSGTPSEATAYFTFSSSMFTISLLDNGNIFHLLSTPVGGGATNVMSVYLNNAPNQNFATPPSFSAGELIAQYSTVKFLGTATQYSGVEAGTLALMSSKDFSFQGQTYNLGQIGSATTISLTFGQPISGSFTGGAAEVAFGGNAVGVGNTLLPTR